jgi:hypothetical protein
MLTYFWKHDSLLQQRKIYLISHNYTFPFLPEKQYIWYICYFIFIIFYSFKNIFNPPCFIPIDLDPISISSL